MPTWHDDTPEDNPGNNVILQSTTGFIVVNLVLQQKCELNLAKKFERVLDNVIVYPRLTMNLEKFEKSFRLTKSIEIEDMKMDSENCRYIGGLPQRALSRFPNLLKKRGLIRKYRSEQG